MRVLWSSLTVFWRIQFTGWVTYSLLSFPLKFILFGDPLVTVLASVDRDVTGFLLTSGMRAFSKEMTEKQAEVQKLQQTINTTTDLAKRQGLVEQLQKLRHQGMETHGKGLEDYRRIGMIGMEADKAIRAAAAQVAKADGYSRVFDSSSMALVYTDGSADITADVKKIISAIKSQEAPSPVPSPGGSEKK